MKLGKPHSESINSLELVCDYIRRVVDQKVLHAWADSGSVQRARYGGPATLVGMKLEVRWSPSVSNTHECPHNGVTNWAKNENGPVEYPGWTGKVWFRLAARSSGFWSNSVDGTGLHLSTGGFGCYDGPDRAITTAYQSHVSHHHADYRRYGRMSKQQYEQQLALLQKQQPITYTYQCSLFDADWPGIANQHAIEQAQHYLTTGERAQNITMSHQWQDPNQAQADREYIQMTKLCPGCNPGMRSSIDTHSRAESEQAH